MPAVVNRVCLTVVLFLTFIFGMVSSVPLSAATAPWISDLPDQVIVVNGVTSTLNFIVGDTETVFTSLSTTAVSSNPALIPNTSTNIVMSGVSSQRSVTIIPNPGQMGLATITLTVTDGSGMASSSSFQVKVTPANTPPTMNNFVGHRIVTLGTTVDRLDFTISDAETSPALLTITARSSNQALVKNSNLSVTGSSASRQLQVQAEPGVTGVAVIHLDVTDADGARVSGECIWAVVDPGAANNAIPQPRGIYLLDSGASPMRDTNIRDKPFIDGYVLRISWGILEPTDGGYDFSIIDNILGKLPAGQKLSLIIVSGNGAEPDWLFTLTPSIGTWTAGSPAVTRPLPWDLTTKARYKQVIQALASHQTGGIALRDNPRLVALNCGIPGLFGGIRDPVEIKIAAMPGYSRVNLQNAVVEYLCDFTDNFPLTPIHVGFWSYPELGATTPQPWEELQQVLLSQFNGILHPRIGFFMENLAANRPAAEADPYSGFPRTTYAVALVNAQDQAYNALQMLGSWYRPFSASHVPNLLNGSPEDAMDFALNIYQCRYFEVYQADVDYDNFTNEFQRWHDFLADLPRPTASLPVVSIVATIANGSELGTNGLVTITRTGVTTAALTVVLAITGTATNGSDYATISTTLTIPAGAATATIAVTVTDDAVHEGSESAIIGLAPSATYTLGATTAATVNIADNDNLNVNPLPLVIPVAPVPGQSFTLTLTTNTNHTVQVVWMWSDGSSATGGVSAAHTFTAAGSYTIQATITDPTTGATTMGVFPLTVAVSPASANPGTGGNDSSGGSGCGAGSSLAGLFVMLWLCLIGRRASA